MFHHRVSQLTSLMPAHRALNLQSDISNYHSLTITTETADVPQADATANGFTYFQD